jgi:hypothetical protein
VDGVAWGVAVAGWQWACWKEGSSAVRMVPVGTCGCGCGGGWVAVKMGCHFSGFLLFLILMAVAKWMVVAVAGWQWACWKEDIEAVRMVLATLCRCGCGGGWVAVKTCGVIFFCFIIVAEAKVGGMSPIVAVARWQWYHSIAGIRAVILRPVATRGSGTRGDRG